MTGDQVARPVMGDICPRCGAAFACGAAGPQPCACAGVGLSAALRQQLAQRFEGCLCRACLQALVNGAPLQPAAAAP
jgi:hypothetical protein